MLCSLKNTFTRNGIPNDISRLLEKWDGYFEKIRNSRYSAPSGHDFLVLRSKRQNTFSARAYSKTSILSDGIRIGSVRNFNGMQFFLDSIQRLKQKLDGELLLKIRATCLCIN